MEPAVRAAIQVALGEFVPPGAQAQPSPAKPIWLDPEWQERHGFTAMVAALRRLERIHPKSPTAWKARVAWEAALGGLKTVLEVADWSESDWEHIYRHGVDHWLRPGRANRREEDFLGQARQERLPWE